MVIKVLAIVFLVVLMLLAWGFFIEKETIKVEKFSLEIENLPSSFKDSKIIHLSDLHSKNFGKMEERILVSLKTLNPDYIFITGDIVDWTTKDLESCKEFWQKLSEGYPGKIFGVLGNHEHRNPRLKTIKSLLDESGIEILVNESVKLEKGDQFIYLIGVDDPHLKHDDSEKAMQVINPGIPKILIAHSPEIFRDIKEKNIDLALVGHTHGGQVNIPLITDFFLPLKYDKKYKEGLFREDSTIMYVNRGIGTTAFPFRLNSFPEITLITLK